MKADFETGFPIEAPPARIPYGIAPDALQGLLGGTCREVNDGYYTLACTALGGLPLNLGFHFRAGRLHKVEVFFGEDDDFASVFPVRQRHLESALGPADEVLATKLKGFAYYKWQAGGTAIEHFLRDRFGLEEHIAFMNDGDAP